MLRLLASAGKAWSVSCRYETLWLRVQVEGMQLVIDDLVGSTGLELKVDPGVPYVYAGFAGTIHTGILHDACQIFTGSAVQA